MYDKQRFLSALGLMKRAGKLVYGDDLMPSITKNKVRLVVLAHDTSDRSKKQITDKASFYGVEVIEFPSREDMSIAIGMHNRTAVGIADYGFIKMLKSCKVEKEEVTQYE